MAGDERRHQLVAELLRVHRRAVLVTGAEQHREHVLALRPASPPRRRSAISSKISSSTRFRRAASVRICRPIQAAGPRLASRPGGGGSSDSGLAANARISPRAARAAHPAGRPGSRPKTARRMISSVSRCSRG